MHSRYNIYNSTALSLVVQRIVSLHNKVQLVEDLSSLTVLTKSTVAVFFAEKLKELLHCKSFSHFFGKKIVAFLHNMFEIFYFLLTNNIISFEQLNPVFYMAWTMVLHTTVSFQG